MLRHAATAVAAAGPQQRAEWPARGTGPHQGKLNAKSHKPPPSPASSTGPADHPADPVPGGSGAPSSDTENGQHQWNWNQVQGPAYYFPSIEKK